MHLVERNQRRYVRNSLRVNTEDLQTAIEAGYTDVEFAVGLTEPTENWVERVGKVSLQTARTHDAG